MRKLIAVALMMGSAVAFGQDATGPYIGVGLGYWDSDLSSSFTGTSDLTGAFSFSGSDSDSGGSIIVGGQWELDRVSIRAELEYFDTASTVDTYSTGVGIHFRF